MLKSVYKILVERPHYYNGSCWANYAGLSLFRIAIYNAAFGLRTRHLHPSVAAHFATMEQDGVCVVPDFLSEEQFLRVTDAYERLIKSGRAQTDDNLDETGVRWTQIKLNAEDPDARIILDATVEHPTFIHLVEAVMRRKHSGRPTVVLQTLEVDDDDCDKGDENSMLHADRMVPCLKAFLYINENRPENGAYVYCPGSHRFTLSRVLHEYRKAIQEARFWNEGRGGRARVPSHLLRSMGVEERACGARQNTLVVANGLGLHRRGQMQPGTTRKQIRFGFHYLEEPVRAETVRAAERRIANLFRSLLLSKLRIFKRWGLYSIRDSGAS